MLLTYCINYAKLHKLDNSLYMSAQTLERSAQTPEHGSEATVWDDDAVKTMVAIAQEVARLRKRMYELDNPDEILWSTNDKHLARLAAFNKEYEVSETRVDYLHNKLQDLMIDFCDTERTDGVDPYTIVSEIIDMSADSDYSRNDALTAGTGNETSGSETSEVAETNDEESEVARASKQNDSNAETGTPYTDLNESEASAPQSRDALIPVADSASFGIQKGEEVRIVRGNKVIGGYTVTDIGEHPYTSVLSVRVLEPGNGMADSHTIALDELMSMQTFDLTATPKSDADSEIAGDKAPVRQGSEQHDNAAPNHQASDSEDNPPDARQSSEPDQSDGPVESNIVTNPSRVERWAEKLKSAVNRTNRPQPEINQSADLEYGEFTAGQTVKMPVDDRIESGWRVDGIATEDDGEKTIWVKKGLKSMPITHERLLAAQSDPVTSVERRSYRPTAIYSKLSLDQVMKNRDGEPRSKKKGVIVGLGIVAAGAASWYIASRAGVDLPGADLINDWHNGSDELVPNGTLDADSNDFADLRDLLDGSDDQSTDSGSDKAGDDGSNGRNGKESNIGGDQSGSGAPEFAPGTLAQYDGYVVQEGDSIWLLSERLLENSGNSTPSIIEIDAVKDRMLAQLQSTGQVGPDGFLAIGQTLHVK